MSERKRKQEKEYSYVSKTFTVGFDADGKRIRKRVFAKSQAELTRKFNALKKQYEMGLDVRWEGITVAEWSAMWLETYKKPNVGEKQYINLCSAVGKHVVKAIGFMPVKDVKEIHLQNIVVGLKGKSKSLTDKVHSCLKGIFATAKSNGLTIINPTETLDVPKNKDNEREPLTPLERELVLKTAYNHDVGLMLLLMIYSGLRKGEVLPLTWEDIDLGTGYINIDKGVSLPVNQAELKDMPKTEAGERKVFIVPALAEKLREAKEFATQDIILKMPDIVPDRDEYISTALKEKLLFPMRDGRIRSNTSYRRLWESFQREMEDSKTDVIEKCEDKNLLKEWKKIDVKEITAHRLRHSFATDLLEAGVQDRAIKYLLGHSQPDVTAIYAKVMSKTLGRAYKLYCEYLGCDKNVINGTTLTTQTPTAQGVQGL